MEDRQGLTAQNKVADPGTVARDGGLVEMMGYLGDVAGRIILVRREFSEMDRLLRETGEWIKNLQVDLLDKLEGRDVRHR